MKKIVFLLFLATIIFGSTFYVVQSCNGPECYFRKHLKEYKKEEVYQNTDRLYGVLLKKSNNKVRADTWMNITQEDAEKVIKNYLIKMYTIYEKAVSPYPGEVSNAISCALEYQPTYTKEKIGEKEAHIFTGFANDRLVFGACAGDLITNRSAVVMFYCEPQKRLYKFELFSPVKNSIEEFNKETNSLKTMPCE